jgi:hypothetical protein
MQTCLKKESKGVPGSHRYSIYIQIFLNTEMIIRGVRAYSGNFETVFVHHQLMEDRAALICFVLYIYNGRQISIAMRRMAEMKTEHTQQELNGCVVLGASKVPSNGVTTRYT